MTLLQRHLLVNDQPSLKVGPRRDIHLCSHLLLFTDHTHRRTPASMETSPLDSMEEDTPPPQPTEGANTRRAGVMTGKALLTPKVKTSSLMEDVAPRDQKILATRDRTKHSLSPNLGLSSQSQVTHPTLIPLHR